MGCPLRAPYLASRLGLHAEGHLATDTAIPASRGSISSPTWGRACHISQWGARQWETCIRLPQACSRLPAAPRSLLRHRVIARCLRRGHTGCPLARTLRGRWGTDHRPLRWGTTVGPVPTTVARAGQHSLPSPARLPAPLPHQSPVTLGACAYSTHHTGPAATERPTGRPADPTRRIRDSASSRCQASVRPASAAQCRQLPTTRLPPTDTRYRQDIIIRISRHLMTIIPPPTTPMASDRLQFSNSTCPTASMASGSPIRTWRNEGR